MITEVYIAAGANLGDRLESLRRAMQALSATPGLLLVRVSPVYETEPWGNSEQPKFLNCAALLECDLGPKQLLTRLKIIEAELGRDFTGPLWGPREIDLDIALFGDLVLCEKGITIPHRYLLERWFMLKPLLDLRPDLRLPGGGKLEAALARLSPNEQGELFAPALNAIAETGAVASDAGFDNGYG